MGKLSFIHRPAREDADSQRANSRSTPSVWKPLLTIACIAIVLITIAGVIVLSLISTFLPDKVVALSSTQNSAAFNIYYATNLTDGASSDITNLNALSRQLTVALRLAGRTSAVIEAQFVLVTDSTSEGKKKKRSTMQYQCEKNPDLAGDPLRLQFSVTHPKGCQSVRCKQRSTAEVDNTIRNVVPKFVLVISFSNGRTVTVQLSYCSSAPITGKCRFGSRMTYSTGVGSFPRTIIAGDMNGDGKPDLIVTNTAADNATVLLNSGTGIFTLQPNVRSVGGLSPYSVTAADFNGDGKLDIAVANYDADSIGVLINQGNGNFTAQMLYPLPPGSSPRSIAAGDVDGNGQPDLVVASSGADDVIVLFNKGNSIFSGRVSYSMVTGSSPYAVALADVDGDGKPDMVVANSGAGNIAVLLNIGSGRFAASTLYSTGAGSSPRAVALADVNNDGKIDIVVANALNDNVGVLLNTASGTFASAAAFSTGSGSSPSAVAVGDVNRDGKADIVVANYASDSVSVLFNSASNGFSTPATFSTGYGSSPASVALTDVNADGKLDIVVANYGSDSVAVFLAC